jgi:hypothetical protein
MEQVSAPTRRAVRAALFAVGRRRDGISKPLILENIRDLGLLLCGDKPAVLVEWWEDPTVARLLEYVIQNRLVTQDRNVVSRDPELAQQIADLWYGRENSVAVMRQLGLLFGYPEACAAWFVCDERLDLEFGNTTGWDLNERRFALCRLPLDPVDLAAAQVWARRLWHNFAEAYGQDIVDLLPISDRVAV